MAKNKASKKKNPAPMLVVQSKIREYLKSTGDYNIGSDLFDAVSKSVASILDDAASRAKLNGRKTIQARDV